jgi:hypothetical protein
MKSIAVPTAVPARFGGALAVAAPPIRLRVERGWQNIGTDEEPITSLLRLAERPTSLRPLNNRRCLPAIRLPNEKLDRA